MMQLLLIRHAQSTWNAQGRIQGWADPPLSETGLDQARKLAQRLVADGHAVAAIYSSPLLRAWQTAEQLGQALGLSVQTDDRLKENDVGQLTGLTGMEVEQRFPEWMAARRASLEWVQPPEGEGRDHFASRAVAVMSDIVARHAGQTVAVVSHGGTLGIYLAHLLEMPIHRSLPFQFDNTSLSVVKVGEHRIRLLKLNDTAHLMNGV
jgi:probable phosphoglycerate mutase